LEEETGTDDDVDDEPAVGPIGPCRPERNLAAPGICSICAANPKKK